jgi:hypothetical protein
VGQEVGRRRREQSGLSNLIRQSKKRHFSGKYVGTEMYVQSGPWIVVLFLLCSLTY